MPTRLSGTTMVAASTLARTPHIHRAGALDVRLATCEEEIRAAQTLRYDIFYHEMGALPSEATRALGRDFDPYDSICDHLLVIDHSNAHSPRVVGTYRLLRELVAGQNHGFYSSGEYDLAPLHSKTFRTRIGEGRQLLELGRSCVHADYRNLSTINLLWRGIASYLATHSIGFMFGCASLHGTDVSLHAEALSYLYHNHLAENDIRVRALADKHVAMNRLPIGGYDPKQAMRLLPPLMKGYLRVGAVVGDGAFIDEQFNTTDVFILMPVDRIAARYSERFIGSANDAA